MTKESLLACGTLVGDSDPAQSAKSLQVVRDMAAALGRASNDMGAHFHEDFRWMGNNGCGTKNGLAEFRRNWQLPLRAAFSDRTYVDEAMFAQGQWVAGFGYIEATHSGEFMRIAPTGRRVRIPYMDFWKVCDGRIVDNWVSVDFPAVLAQLGVDVFKGEGWERYDEGRAVPPVPPA
jgi:predicted ester cyclase